MLKRVFVCLFCFALIFPAFAYSFDCNRPDFGARIEDLNKDGDFVKYMEKDGVSYYNYTGSCRMDIHNINNIRTSYAFVDNQLYARIIDVPGRDDLGSHESRSKNMERRISQQIGTNTYETKEDGEWTIFQWYNEKDKTKFKLKLSRKTLEQKSAFYYEPLRTKLSDTRPQDDPASLSE